MLSEGMLSSAGLGVVSGGGGGSVGSVDLLVMDTERDRQNEKHRKEQGKCRKKDLNQSFRAPL